MALGALGVILILGLLRQKIGIGLLCGSPLFLGLWCFQRSRGSNYASGLRVCGLVLGSLGLGLVLDNLIAPIGFAAFSLLIGLFLAWLFET